MANKECFSAQQWVMIKEKLEELPDSKAVQVTSTSFRNPTLMLIISIFLGELGIDRFMIGDYILGALKLITGGGCSIWWIIDIFLIKNATYEYNMKKFNESIMI